MTFGICPLSVVPVRNGPSDKSEMSSQVLFGELVEILEKKGKQWLKIRCNWDNNVGWVATNQIKLITPSEFDDFQNNFAYNLELVQAIMGNDHFLPITLGAQLPNFDGLRFTIGDHSYTFSGQAIFPKNVDAPADFLLKVARRYLNAPYLWGGRSPLGIDSAGFIQVVFKMAGFFLPRESAQQVHVGQTVDFIEQAVPGDLAFFENRTGKITHVGIIFPDQQVIHAFGFVKIDSLDHFGIYDLNLSRYTHKLRVIKRIIPLAPEQKSKEESATETLNKQVELF